MEWGERAKEKREFVIAEGESLEGVSSSRREDRMERRMRLQKMECSTR